MVIVNSITITLARTNINPGVTARRESAPPID